MTDPYASEADTLALIRRDQRSDVEKKLEAMLDERGALEMGAEPFLILRQITLEQMTTIESFTQAITDLENQPSQFGTVTMEYMQREIAAEREAANNAYRERNQLVALLSTLFPSGKAKTAIEGWDEAWHGCVYIDFPWGQASWHYHTDDEWMFAHLPPYTKVWDGHTTEAKYAAIAAAIRARGQE